MEHDFDLTPLYVHLAQLKRDRGTMLSFIRAVADDSDDRVSPGVKAAAREALRQVGER